MFQISRKFCEALGCDVWSVGRRDGAAIKDGIESYNFLVDEWERAIECVRKLAAQYS